MKPDKDRFDLRTGEGARAWIERVQAITAESWLQGAALPDAEPLRTGAFIFATAHPGGASVDPCGEAVFVPVPGRGDVGDREVLAAAVRKLALLTRAVGVVIFTEAWVSEDASALSSGKTLEGRQSTREALVCMVEHRVLGVQLWHAYIQREPVGLDSWQQLEGGAQHSGRFTRLLPEKWQN